MKFFHRSTYFALALFAGATSLAVAATPHGPASTIAAPAADLRGARDLGRLPAAQSVRLSVSLRLRDESNLDRLIAAQSNPRSPVYRHFLSAAQVRDAFGATAPDYASTVAALQRAGFSIVGKDPMRTLIDVRAPAAIVERYFSTTLHAITADGRQTAYANVTPAVLPVALRPTVNAVAGFQSRPLFTTDSAAAYAAHSGHKTGPGTPAARPMAGPTATPEYGPDGGYGPQLVDSAFDMPVRHGYFGNGVTVADIIDGTFDDTMDIAPYLAEFNIKRTGPPTTIIPVDGGCVNGPFGCFDSFQAAIDAQGVIGVSPGVAYDLYEIPSPLYTSNIIDGFKAVVNDNRVDVVNFSVAGCEAALGEGAFIIDQSMRLGSAEGISFVDVAFGGSNPCFTNGPSVQAPSDSPNGLTVGGADSFADQYGNVTSPPLADPSSGGGVSILFSLPGYQRGVPGVIPRGRNLPDLDGPDAINGVGPSLYYGAFGGFIGGFPFVDNAFLTGGIAGVAQIEGSRLGLVNTLLYPAAVRNRSLFRDITMGCNGIGGGGPYCAKPGFDQVSGFGVPKLYPIAKAI
ncbi:MAG: hypothetical protein GIX03_04890 [Candidatus Eremiobacteraeota bacterium]|nr:hypothetical protein [Candidatus Eremiobacteraeota bacterium]MBC5802333.1 hypothetical protein [Candidatus Eremiobacteraeota bacterium]MBC5822714.1 hypothetical protein [Candidatus Eremiobacteraeota bacterium]